MINRELMEDLDGYGEHLPVRIELEAANTVGFMQNPVNDMYLDFAVDVRVVDGESMVVLTAIGKEDS